MEDDMKGAADDADRDGYRAGITREPASPAWPVAHLRLDAGAAQRAVSAERTRPVRILLVDDDPAIQRMVQGYLANHDMRTTAVPDRQAAAQQFSPDDTDLVLLDLRLGRHDGLDLLREIRARSDVPVIVITGNRRDEIDRVVGLELGADDYVTKPFGLRELLARIRAVLRRRTASPAGRRGADTPRLYEFGGWKLDRQQRSLLSPEGNAVPLTKGEFGLLCAFLDAPQRPLSREHLLQATRVHEDIFDRSIDVQVLRLRRKLETDTNAPRVIRTERGVGYVFTLDVQWR
jgi:two-component system, OmpR family, response regulator